MDDLIARTTEATAVAAAENFDALLRGVPGEEIEPVVLPGPEVRGAWPGPVGQLVRWGTSLARPLVKVVRTLGGAGSTG